MQSKLDEREMHATFKIKGVEITFYSKKRRKPSILCLHCESSMKVNQSVDVI